MTLLAAALFVVIFAHAWITSPNLKTGSFTPGPVLILSVILVLALTALFDFLVPVIT